MIAATPMPALVLIAALDRNRAIGRDNDLPWRRPDDLKRVTALTRGKPGLMGRRTAESLGRAPPHQYRLAQRQRLEALEVVGQAPRQVVVAPDGAVAVQRGNQYQRRHRRGCSQTATGALIAGCGS